MTDPEASLWQPTYSPRRVRFYLAHWAEVEAIAQSPASAANLRAYLQREWELLHGARGRTCLCPMEHAPHAETLGRSGFGDGAHGAAHVLADLARAADALPVDWAVTRLIARTMGRERLWGMAYCAAHALPASFPLAPILDPDPTLHDATLAMARTLGWVSPIRGGSLPARAG